MAELEALLMRLPDTVLEQFRDESFSTNFRAKHPQLFSDTAWVDIEDLKKWLRQRADLNHLLEPTISEMAVRPVGLDPRLSSGMDANFGNASFDLYPVDGYLPRSATPSSGYSVDASSYLPRSATPSSSYSFNPYDDYQASIYSGPGSEGDYFGASGFSTPSSGLDLFDGNAYDPNLDWDSSLASFFDSVEATASGSGSNPSFESTGFSPSESWGARGSDPNTWFLLPDIIPSNGSAPQLTGTDREFSPPPGSSEFNADDPILMTQEEMDEASEAWEWLPSDTIWLDKNVSSDVYIPPEPFPVTKNQKVVRLERVHGIPSQFPVPRVPTAYIINFSSVRDAYKNADGEVMKLETILKDKDCHAWDGTPGERQANRAPKVNGQLFAALGHFGHVQCRRARQLCHGVMFCPFIDPVLIDVERYELDPHARDTVNNAQIVQRLNQGSIIQDKAICYVNAVNAMKCTGTDTAGGACGGYQVLKQAELPSGRKYYFACSNRSNSWKNHSGIQIPPDVDEDWCVRLFRGESIIDGTLESTSEPCSRIIGSGSGKKGKSECPFPHLKEGKAYTPAMLKRNCDAATAILVPLDEESIPIAIVIPKHLCPHTHPPPPATRVPTDVRLLYERAVRTYGISIATVNKVEQAPSTIEIMGAAPGLVHPSLLNVSTKQTIITALKRREPGGDKSGWEGLFDLYKADQAKEPRQRYIHSFDFLPGRSPPSAVITTFEAVLLECVQWVRSLDQDTTFKRMKADLLNEYELTAFLAPLNRLFTFGRIYMDAKDSDAFEFAWDKIHEAFFCGNRKTVGLQGRMDADKRPTVDEFLPKVLRICRRHALDGLRKSVRPHVDEDQWLRFEGLVALKTRADVDTFSDWVFSLNINQVTAWWNHKLNHKWILPGPLECLSGLSHEEWLTTPFTSNGNETQHHWTNSQTGIGLNARECILRAAKADHAVSEHFEASLASGVMASNRNELSHRTARNAKRHTSAIEKAKNASSGNNKIKELKAELAMLMAEAKVSHSFIPKAVKSRPKRSKTTTTDDMDLDGIEMASLPEVQVETAIQADPLEPENSQVSNEVSMSEPNLDVDGKQDGEMISKGDLDVAGPRAVSVTTFAPSPVAPPQSEPREPQLSTRRSSRKRGASKTHEDAPVRKSKKAEVAAAPEPSGSRKRRTTRKPKAWSVRHTDDQIYTSFEFLAQFPDEYRTLYGDAEPA
ncbi:hypothetical protein B0H14DRAFT_2702312 [Mycena olivaceomarginata]|nr:hypothetical protein B0H14DRAFT_2702312 [Mycena olivaceomarginata]